MPRTRWLPMSVSAQIYGCTAQPSPTRNGSSAQQLQLVNPHPYTPKQSNNKSLTRCMRDAAKCSSLHNVIHLTDSPAQHDIFDSLSQHPVDPDTVSTAT